MTKESMPTPSQVDDLAQSALRLVMDPTVVPTETGYDPFYSADTAINIYDLADVWVEIEAVPRPHPLYDEPIPYVKISTTEEIEAEASGLLTEKQVGYEFWRGVPGSPRKRFAVKSIDESIESYSDEDGDERGETVYTAGERALELMKKARLKRAERKLLIPTVTLVFNTERYDKLRERIQNCSRHNLIER